MHSGDAVPNSLATFQWDISTIPIGGSGGHLPKQPDLDGIKTEISPDFPPWNPMAHPMTPWPPWPPWPKVPPFFAVASPR